MRFSLAITSGLEVFFFPESSGRWAGFLGPCNAEKIEVSLDDVHVDLAGGPDSGSGARHDELASAGVLSASSGSNAAGNASHAPGRILAEMPSGYKSPAKQKLRQSIRTSRFKKTFIEDVRMTATPSNSLLLTNRCLLNPQRNLHG